jgi:hypothetical protein
MDSPACAVYHPAMLINAAGDGMSNAQPNPAAARRSAADDRRDVVVQREWNGWRTATVRVSDLQDVHWFQPAGAPRPLIHAYVSCGDIHSGQIPHECQATPPPHRVLVCVLKSHTAARIFEQLTLEANEQRTAIAGAPPR